MGSSSSMKVHPFARGLWDHHQQLHEPPALTLGCKRFRPLAPKLSSSNINGSASVHHHNGATFDLKSFIKPESGPRKFSSDEKKDPAPQQVEAHPGGTRWNPTQEQIGILEMLYRGGMRTPNAQQIEQITEQLGKYGKIEGKNVFYWFQNHKARERQKQKRNILGLSHSPRTPMASSTVNNSMTLTLDTRVDLGHDGEISPYKRKFRSWTLECTENLKDNCANEGDKTLELFPLHPEGR